jgi:Tol biopolymer transport system component
VVVRTTDTNADGRVNSSDLPVGDINYNGTSNDATDQQLLADHADHWKRHALHGTLVRRTNLLYREYPNLIGAIGDSQIFWSPSGRWLTYTVHGPVGSAKCHVFIVPAEPSIGDRPVQITWFPDTSDYDPSWSPLNTDIVFGRADYSIVRKGIPGLNADTTEKLVSVSGNATSQGDVTPAISPDGQWVAFARRDTVVSGYHIWKARIGGGSETQLTFTPSVEDWYPNWSPDGEWIMFDREIGFPNEHNSYKVKANQTQPGDTLTTAILRAPPGTDAATPGYSPDGRVITLGIGTHSSSILDVRAHTLDPTLATPKPILNYPDTAFAIHGPDPVLSPKISPDGTRLALRSRQVWAARQNMNLPPRITFVTKVGSHPTAIADSAAVFTYGQNPPAYACFTMTATDPEGDAFTWSPDILGPHVTYDAVTHRLCWLTSEVGTDYAKMRVSSDASGGSDVLIFEFVATNALGPSAQRAQDSEETREAEVAFQTPNPSTGIFTVEAPGKGGEGVSLAIYDVGGRHVTTIRGRSGVPLSWSGRDRQGARVPAGIYLYQLDAGRSRTGGKIVLLH